MVAKSGTQKLPKKCTVRLLKPADMTFSDLFLQKHLYPFMRGFQPFLFGLDAVYDLHKV
jgi:hypothetical protein